MLEVSPFCGEKKRMKEGWTGAVGVVYNLKEVVREDIVGKEMFKESLEGERMGHRETWRK